jgi:hypothetical protein
MNKARKIQCLLVSHLLKEGQIQLNLPGGMKVELGVVQEGEQGMLEKTSDYCWLIANQKDRTVSMDSYNLGLQYLERSGKIIVEDDKVNIDGDPIRILTAI